MSRKSSHPRSTAYRMPAGWRCPGRARRRVGCSRLGGWIILPRGPPSRGSRKDPQEPTAISTLTALSYAPGLAALACTRPPGPAAAYPASWPGRLAGLAVAAALARCDHLYHSGTAAGDYFAFRGPPASPCWPGATPTPSEPPSRPPPRRRRTPTSALDPPTALPLFSLFGAYAASCGLPGIRRGQPGGLALVLPWLAARALSPRGAAPSPAPGGLLALGGGDPGDLPGRSSPWWPRGWCRSSPRRASPRPGIHGTGPPLPGRGLPGGGDGQGQHRDPLPASVPAPRRPQGVGALSLTCLVLTLGATAPAALPGRLASIRSRGSASTGETGRINDPSFANDNSATILGLDRVLYCLGLTSPGVESAAQAVALAGVGLAGAGTSRAPQPPGLPRGIDRLGVDLCGDVLLPPAGGRGPPGPAPAVGLGGPEGGSRPSGSAVALRLAIAGMLAALFAPGSVSTALQRRFSPPGPASAAVRMAVLPLASYGLIVAFAAVWAAAAMAGRGDRGELSRLG